VAWAVHGICRSRLVPSRARSELESRPGE
jgi:hypothetical protein